MKTATTKEIRLAKKLFRKVKEESIRIKSQTGDDTEDERKMAFTCNRTLRLLGLKRPVCLSER